MQKPFCVAGDQEVIVSASIGISLYPDDGDTATGLIQHADAALYQAKARGRDSFCFYSSALTAAVSERMQIELGLRRALERGELLIHYARRLLALSAEATQALASDVDLEVLRIGMPEDFDARRMALAAAAEADLAYAKSREAVTRAELAQRESEVAELRRRLQLEEGP